MMMNAISLFSGIGGMDIGFSATGFNIIAQVEIDDYCRRVLKRHAPEWWENAKRFTDVCEFGRDSVAGEIDVIFGGFPCQPHSVAGTRKGALDSRNLWPEFRRIIGEFRPRAVLLENVPGILSTGYAPTVIAELAQMGYVGRSGIISAQDAGAPHRRERWWCVAYAERTREKSFKIHDRNKPQASQAGKASTFIPSGEGSSNVEYATAPRLQRYITPTKRSKTRYSTGRLAAKQHKRQTKSRFCRADHGLPYWLDSPRWPATQGNEQYDYEAPRTVQAKTAHDANRIKSLGNAVVPQIVYALAVEIKKHLQTNE